MKSLCRHSKRNGGLWAAIAVFSLLVTGCAGWRSERFDLGRLRDERAADIDSRLSKARPPVENPFGTPDDR